MCVSQVNRLDKGFPWSFVDELFVLAIKYPFGKKTTTTMLFVEHDWTYLSKIFISDAAKSLIVS